MLLIPFLALALAQGQTPAAGPMMTLGDKQVAFHWVDPTPPEADAALAGWKGWGYLKGGPAAEWSRNFPVGHVKPEVPSEKAVATLRLKVIILAQRFEQNAENPPKIYRFSMPEWAIQEELESVARETEYLRAALRGLAEVDVDVEVRKTTIFSTPYELKHDTDHWVESRINGYGFEADDKVKRGPFHWVEVRTPKSVNPPLHEMALANLAQLALDKGYQVGAGEDTLTPEMVKDVLSFKPSTAADYKSHRGLKWSVKVPDAAKNSVMTFHSENVLVALADDPERGKVLKLTERGYYRLGGLVLPKPGSFAGHKKLTFFLKSEAKDALHVILNTPDGVTDLTIGAPSDGQTLPFKNDGTWQKITVPLHVNGNQVGSVALGAPTGTEKQQIRNPIYQLDDFQFEDDDQPVAYAEFKPDFDSPYATLRLKALAQYVAQPAAELKDKAFKLLDDPDDHVRIAAVLAFAKAPETEAKLIENVFHIDGFVSEAAIEALAETNSELGWAQIRKALAPGTPLRRMAAARALAGKQDSKLAGPISGLIGDPDPAVRRAAALAIASIPGDESSKIITVFFNDIDPDVASAAVEAANGDDSFIARRVQYLAVNDPWDSIRLAAYLKLAASKNPDIRKEGWKGVRDDSELVRTMFITKAPEGPELPAAIKQAYSDSNPSVRGAAVRRLVAGGEKLAGAIPAEAFANEYSASVIKALLDGAETLKLPTNVVETLRASKGAESR